MKFVVNFLVLLLMSGCFFSTKAQSTLEQPSDARMEWWRDARFGMFIHWGLYAIPAGEWNGKTGYGEWIRHSARIPIETYDQFQSRFNPVKFDADTWVKTARDAGMKYIVITSKHHDGFCMFNTEQTEFNIMNTPYGRDVMKELSAACHKYGLKFCFYYSIMDWHHPDYLPRREWETDRSTDSADFNRYVSYMKAELKELLTQYGEIGVLWFDGEWEATWSENFGKEIYTYVKSLQPDIIINNRVGAGRLDMEGMIREGAFGGDFGTPEQQIPPTGLPGTDWETCMTMNDHWGYNKANTEYKPAKELIRMLTDIASKGGNYLLNLGPTDQGTLPKQAVTRLREIGWWMSVNGESIYGTVASPLVSTPWGRCTMKDNKDTVILYLHVFHWPDNGRLLVEGCMNQPLKAVLLAKPGKILEVSQHDDKITILLPAKAPDKINSVVRLTVQGPLDITNPPEIVAFNDFFVDRTKIELLTNRPNVEIRFTGDGNDPVDTSFLYSEPLEVMGDVTVKARCFRDGKPVSGTAVRKFKMLSPLAPKNVRNPEPGVEYQYYEGDWDSLPDFARLTPVRTGILPSFSFDPRSDKEHFGFSYKGYILIPKRSIYTFSTESDDGSQLYIGSKLVVDNDGLHGLRRKEGSIGLTAGFHPIRVLFFEKTGSDVLNVFIQSPDLPEQLVPQEWLVHEK
ncbi:MAG: alpha-L-fucosidase [Bacteroidales bacterium]|nr:alpha-L-fucosidase [Bacteroidales bacterium]